MHYLLISLTTGSPKNTSGSRAYPRRNLANRLHAHVSNTKIKTHVHCQGPLFRMDWGFPYEIRNCLRNWVALSFSYEKSSLALASHSLSTLIMGSFHFPNHSTSSPILWHNLATTYSLQTLPIPLIHNQPKWAIQFIPLLINIGIAAGIGTRTAGLTTSLNYYQSLSKDLTESLEEIATSLITIQNQLDSPGSHGPPKQMSMKPSYSKKWAHVCFWRKRAASTPRNQALLRKKAKVAQLCLTLCNPTNYTVHRTL